MEILDSHIPVTDNIIHLEKGLIAPNIQVTAKNSELASNEAVQSDTQKQNSDPVKVLENGSSAQSQRSTSNYKKCEMCSCAAAIYRCPRCEMQTCSVLCVKQHKVKSGCSGERDKTAFVDISLYNDKDLLNDYRFLEDAERKLFSNVSSVSKRQNTRFSPYHLSKRCKFLMNAAFKRGISLSFVHPGLSKNKINTSFFTISTDTIEWHVDWLFSTSNTLVKDNKVPETCVLIEAVRKFINFTEYPHHKKSLEDYRGDKLDTCQFLLKVENMPANKPRYFPLNYHQTIAQNLNGICLIEYPTIVIVPSSDLQAQEKYKLLCKEDMVEMERSSARHMIKFHPELDPSGQLESDILNINSSIYTADKEKETKEV